MSKLTEVNPYRYGEGSLKTTSFPDRLIYISFTIPDYSPDIFWENMDMKFDIGLNGLPYAIFKDNSYSSEYDDLVGQHGVGHWGNYENCVLLQPTIGL